MEVKLHLSCGKIAAKLFQITSVVGRNKNCWEDSLQPILHVVQISVTSNYNTSDPD